MSRNLRLVMIGIDLVFAIFLFYIAWGVFVSGDTFFRFGEVGSAIIAGISLMLGAHNIARVGANILILTGRRSPRGAEETPEYGYQDEWEQENL